MTDQRRGEWSAGAVMLALFLGGLVVWIGGLMLILRVLSWLF